MHNMANGEKRYKPCHLGNPQHAICTPLIGLPNAFCRTLVQVAPAKVAEFEEVEVDVDAVLGNDAEVGLLELLHKAVFSGWCSADGVQHKAVFSGWCSAQGRVQRMAPQLPAHKL